MIKITDINNTNLLRIKSILDNSGIIVFPTETVWGIGCKYDNTNAINKIYKLKGRNFNNPLQIQVSSISMIKKFTSEIITSPLEKLMNFYLPGPLSIVLEKKDVPDYVTSELSTVAFRFSSLAKLTKIIDYIGYPIASTSCNLSGAPIIKNRLDVIEFANTFADILIDTNVDLSNVASTIIKYNDGKIDLIREGSIKYSEIQKRLMK